MTQGGLRRILQSYRTCCGAKTETQTLQWDRNSPGEGLICVDADLTRSFQALTWSSGFGGGRPSYPVAKLQRHKAAFEGRLSHGMGVPRLNTYSNPSPPPA